ncbi:MAG: hypothetical protein ABSA03_09405 [Streptosporangiaceae bacterium]|jgi:hypothetical protein
MCRLADRTAARYDVVASIGDAVTTCTSQPASSNLTAVVNPVIPAPSTVTRTRS